MSPSPLRRFVACCPLFIAVAMMASVAYAGLPQDHGYQRVLRAHMATLTEADFDHGQGEKPLLTALEDHPDPEVRYRSHMLNQMIPPMVGSKRGTPSVNFPPSRFTLAEIEPGDGRVMSPMIDACSLMSFTSWDYPGNPLHDSRALKHRAFVNAAVQLMMGNQYHEENPTHGRADWHAYQLVYFGFPYGHFKDILPANVQAAYVEGMEQYARRLLSWPIRGEEANMDMIQAASLWYVYDESSDAELKAAIEERVRALFTDPRRFHPAGYWVERGGLDIGFAGMANYFANWAALKSGRDDAADAVDRVYRLRAHLILTEPDGSLVGPTHFNNRLGSDPHGDQWAWGLARDYAASMITDEAAHLVSPTVEQLAQAGPGRVGGFNAQISENPVKSGGGFLANEEIQNQPWRFRMWYNWNFPVTLNPAYDHYKPGSWAHRQALEKAASPMLKAPFDRGEHFIRNFEEAFFVAHQPTYTAILHTGPVGRHVPGEPNYEFHGPMGFGGGQLSAFSTRAAGAAILGRRAGQNWDKTFDVTEEWRTWPIHAVSGQTAAGKVFTSARIADPVVASDVSASVGTVTVSGVIPADQLKQEQALTGELGYARTFTIDRNGVKVATTIKGDGKDSLAELYETLPAFHRQNGRNDTPVTTIELQVGGSWTEATDQAVKNVTAIRLSRFEGAVEVRFDRPRVVKLSPAEFRDTHMSRAVARTVLIDLLENDGRPATLTGEKSVSYTIRAAQ